MIRHCDIQLFKLTIYASDISHWTLTLSFIHILTAVWSPSWPASDILSSACNTFHQERKGSLWQSYKLFSLCLWFHTGLGRTITPSCLNVGVPSEGQRPPIFCIHNNDGDSGINRTNRAENVSEKSEHELRKNLLCSFATVTWKSLYTFSPKESWHRRS